MQRSNYGFTLVESVIYSALFALAMISFVSFALAFVNMKNKIQTANEVDVNSREIDSQIARLVRQASAVLIPASGSASSTLAVITPGGGINTVKSENGALTLSANGTEPVAISTNRVEVKNLVFTNMADDTRPTVIKMNLSLEGSGSSPDYVINKGMEMIVCKRQ